MSVTQRHAELKKRLEDARKIVFILVKDKVSDDNKSHRFCSVTPKSHLEYSSPRRGQFSFGY